MTVLRRTFTYFDKSECKPMFKLDGSCDCILSTSCRTSCATATVDASEFLVTTIFMEGLPLNLAYDSAFSRRTDMSAISPSVSRRSPLPLRTGMAAITSTSELSPLLRSLISLPTPVILPPGRSRKLLLIAASASAMPMPSAARWYGSTATCISYSRSPDIPALATPGKDSNSFCRFFAANCNCDSLTLPYKLALITGNWVLTLPICGLSAFCGRSTMADSTKVRASSIN